MAAKPYTISPARLFVFHALAGTEFSWPDGFKRSMARQSLDRMDILHVVRTGSLIERKQEIHDGEEIVIGGTTCDDVSLEITLWTDEEMNEVVLLSVKAK